MRPSPPNGINSWTLLCDDVYDQARVYHEDALSGKEGRCHTPNGMGPREGAQAGHARGSRASPRGTRDSQRQAALCYATKSRDIMHKKE